MRAVKDKNDPYVLSSRVTLNRPVVIADHISARYSQIWMRVKADVITVVSGLLVRQRGLGRGRTQDEACWSGKREGEKVVRSFSDSEVEARSPRSDRRLAAAARTGKMARRCGRATSRFTGDIRIYPTKLATVSLLLCCLCLFFPSAAEAGLFSASDQVILLTPENVESVLINSTAAIVAEFYASWCGHCVAFPRSTKVWPETSKVGTDQTI